METMISQTEKRWLLLSLCVIGVLCLSILGKMYSPAKAQAEFVRLSDGSVQVIPLMIDRDRYGIAMMDTAAQTLWIYELDNRATIGGKIETFSGKKLAV